MSDADRKRNQEDFVRDDVSIIVATIAFGMGINKPNVRFVVHYDLPKNIESYYQQIGRAGRDGLPADCLLLFGRGDLQKQRYFIDKKEKPEREKANKLLFRLVDYAETKQCRRIELLKYFSEYHPGDCDQCDNCKRKDAEKIDVTEQAQKFLSCCVRTDQLFGMVHIIRVLRGSKAQQVLKHNHQKLSTYDIGNEWTKQQWRLLADYLIGYQYIVKGREYGSLKLTDLAWEVLKGEKEVKLPKQEFRQLERSTSHRTSKKTAGKDHVLFERMKKKRKEIADTAGLPPYAVLHDKSLLEMCTHLPMNKQQLLNIHGVGKVKADKYGDDFLPLIHKFKKEQQEITKRNHQTDKPKHVSSGELFNEGKSITELANLYGVKKQTVLTHLFKFVRDGYQIENPEHITDYLELPDEDQLRIMDAFHKLGPEQLKPVHDHFEGEFSYEQLKPIRLLCQVQREADDG